MIIPQVPTENIMDENGSLHPVWQNFFNILVTQMQKDLSNEGIKAPEQANSNFAKLAGTDKKGAILYDSDNDVLKVNINGTFKTILTS